MTTSTIGKPWELNDPTRHINSLIVPEPWTSEITWEVWKDPAVTNPPTPLNQPLKLKVSCWLVDQPIWNICSSKWVHLPHVSGWKFKKYLKPPCSSWLVHLKMVLSKNYGPLPLLPISGWWTRFRHRAWGAQTPWTTGATVLALETHGFCETFWWVSTHKFIILTIRLTISRRFEHSINHPYKTGINGIAILFLRYQNRENPFTSRHKETYHWFSSGDALCRNLLHSFRPK